MTKPRFAFLQVRLRTLMITMAVVAVVLASVFQVAPILERRSRYLAMAENCAEVAARYRAGAERTEATLAAARAPDAKNPYGEVWLREYQGRLEKLIRDDRRSAGGVETLGRKYRRAASRPWRSIEE